MVTVGRLVLIEKGFDCAALTVTPERWRIRGAAGAGGGPLQYPGPQPGWDGLERWGGWPPGGSQAGAKRRCRGVSWRRARESWNSNPFGSELVWAVPLGRDCWVKGNSHLGKRNKNRQQRFHWIKITRHSSGLGINAWLLWNHLLD